MARSPEPPPSNAPDREELRKRNARNALREAEQRREAIERANAAAREEKFGRGGLDPARFGDWEVKGIASDF